MKSSTKAAIITAAIGGLFTVAAGLLTYWLTTREPELSYTLSASPSVISDSGLKRIAVLEVRNTGRKEIDNALIQIAVPAGEINESAFSASPGIEIAESKDKNILSLKADLLNPEDSVKASVLFTSNSASAAPQVTVRAPGVRGRELKLGGARDKGLLVSILPVLVAAMASVLSLVTVRSRTLQNRLGLKIASASLSSLDQRELFALVLGECGLSNEADRIRFSSPGVTYRGIADYLVHLARSSPPEIKQRIATCLRAVAIHASVAPKSFAILRDGIVEISGKDFSQKELEYIQKSAFREGENPSEWRSMIRKFVSDESGGQGDNSSFKPKPLRGSA